MTLAIGIVSLTAVYVARSNAETLLGMMLLATLVVLTVFLTQTKTAIIEIDRDKGVVRKTTTYLLVFTLRNSYPLQEFDSVLLTEKDELIEEGYWMVSYSIVLTGTSRSLELYSTSVETECKKRQKELSEFLHVRANDHTKDRRELLIDKTQKPGQAFQHWH